MFKIRTNQIQTWSFESPVRHCLIIKRETVNTIPDGAEIINDDLLRGNYNIKIKR